MGYKRAEWHSGLTYSQTCETCHTQVTYTDHHLGFRPWYPDGFVYCPTCKSPLRHNERYAIDRPSAPESAPVQPADTVPSSGGAPAFCSKCGRAFCEGENFCPKCGNKR